MEDPEEVKKEEDKRIDNEQEEKVDERERNIDEQLEQSFPASDPPSYSRPGNDNFGEA
ncbi:hypothetical protein [Sphingobacterium sp.]|uniref:hypothetical protein n=1 Tax=Sphingobacterium sp. TaxID=341027 RepID=UPI0031E32FFE